MPFVKTGVGVSDATLVGKDHPDFQTPLVGQEKDGRVWDGESWVPKEDPESKSDEKTGK